MRPPIFRREKLPPRKYITWWEVLGPRRRQSFQVPRMTLKKMKICYRWCEVKVWGSEKEAVAGRERFRHVGTASRLHYWGRCKVELAEILQCTYPADYALSERILCKCGVVRRWHWYISYSAGKKGDCYFGSHQCSLPVRKFCQRCFQYNGHCSFGWELW